MNFFAPMSRYASAGGGPIAASREFKEMVKALHNVGIEVCRVFFFVYFLYFSIFTFSSLSTGIFLPTYL